MMKMHQITIEVDIHGTADWMEDHNVTGNVVAEAIRDFLKNMEGINHSTTTVTKDEDYSI